MTRQEWFDKQTPELQNNFKNNCNTLNNTDDFFEYWINSKISTGICGAFIFDASKEGHEYWYKINEELERPK